jgi:hypothetical protein
MERGKLPKILFECLGDKFLVLYLQLNVFKLDFRWWFASNTPQLELTCERLCAIFQY